MTHGPSGIHIQTDAPVDNGGKGASFSPTDLMAGALGACMLTIVGLVAKRHGLDVTGAKANVVKEMVNDPRRIGKLSVVIKLPAALSPTDRQLLEKAALTCPVHKSLLPEIETPIIFQYA